MVWVGGVCLGLCTRGRQEESPKEEGEVDRRESWKLVVRKEGCGQKKTGGWCLLLCSCGMKIMTSSRRKAERCSVAG